MHHFISLPQKKNIERGYIKPESQGRDSMLNTIINDDSMERMTFEERLKGDNYRYILLADSLKKREQ